MSKKKVTAFQITDEGAAAIASDDPQHFGSIPGLWMKGVPVRLDSLDPGMGEADFKRTIKDLGLPIEEVKVDEDYQPGKGLSQLELRSRGELGHIPPGTSDPGESPFDSMPKRELVIVAAERGIEGAEEMRVGEIRERLKEIDVGVLEQGGTGALESSSTTGAPATGAASADTAPSGGADASVGSRA